MKFFFLLSSFIILFFSGCSTRIVEGKLKSNYDPLYIDVNTSVDKSKVAYIKATDGIIIYKVDGKKLKSKPRKYLIIKRGAQDSVVIKGGNHSIVVRHDSAADVKTYDGYRFYVTAKNTRLISNFKAGHEYIIHGIAKVVPQSHSESYIWVKDITEDKIILGKEVFAKDLMPKNEQLQTKN